MMRISSEFLSLEGLFCLLIFWLGIKLGVNSTRYDLHTNWYCIKVPSTLILPRFCWGCLHLSWLLHTNHRNVLWRFSFMYSPQHLLPGMARSWGYWQTLALANRVPYCHDPTQAVTSAQGHVPSKPILDYFPKKLGRVSLVFRTILK